MQKVTQYPRLLLAFFAALFVNASWGQCTATSTGCEDEVIYYLDVDGDGYGVDDAEWNRYCCSGATPSEMYTAVSGDIRPHDPAITAALIEGCTFSEACNYNSSATIYDGSCLFPIPGCRSCALPLTTDGTGTYNPNDPCDCSGDVDLYVDALGYCGGDCVIDADGDGMCDCTTDADGDGQCDCETTDDSGNCLTYVDQVDPCWVAGESLDDCGECTTSAAARTFTIDGIAGGVPCFPGDPNCLDASGKCNCDDEELNSCGDCGAPEPAPGFDCDDAISCLSDTIPAGGNQICDLEDIIGCRDANACNYNPDATYGDDSELCGTVDECGICNGQGIPAGACPCDQYPSEGCDCYTLPEPGYLCNGDCINDADGDGVCDEFEVLGCTDSNACNYDANATEEDLTQCDYLDALLDCGGTCAADLDGDGQCDDIDDCIGTKDICGVCNGQGIPEGDCDCLGNTLDALDNCGGGCLQDVDEDGKCDLDVNGHVADDFICDGEADALGVCNGSCTADADQDGVCDDVDDCIGYIDACGTCNGSGIPAGDCDCDGNQYDAINVCGGTCQTDADGDGVCDDNGNDGCDGVVDECGVCNGPGIPAGYCDCQGNQEDILGNCGGNCLQDLDEDGICDLDSDNNIMDGCVGVIDECGICNGTGPLPGCGCEPIERGECDCNGNVLDVCGVCGGDGPDPGEDCDGNCLEDTDGDGICDAVDPLVVPRVFVGAVADGRTKLTLPPSSIEDAYNDLINKHRAMALNLDDGSLTGESNHLTVQNHILGKGSLAVEGLGTMESNVTVNGFVHVDKSLFMDGDLSVDGVTFTNGGMSSSSLNNSGDMLLQGDSYIGMNAHIDGATTTENVVGISGHFRVHNGLLNGDFDPTFSRVRFSVSPSTGNMRMWGDLDADGDMNVAGKATLLGMNADGDSRFGNMIMDGALDLNSSMDISGDLRVNTNKFVVVGSSGSTFIGGDAHVARNMSIHGRMHILKNMTITGTTFANGGMVTTSVTMDGDLEVGGNINIGKDFSVGGVTTALNNLTVGGEFSVYDGSTAELETSMFSLNPLTGNLTSSGTLSLGRSVELTENLNVGSNLTASGRMSIERAAAFNGMSVSGDATIKGDDHSFLGTSRVAGTTDIGGTLTANGISELGTLNNTGEISGGRYTLRGTPGTSTALLDLTGDAPAGHALAHFENTSTAESAHGIEIKLGTLAPGIQNDYVTFMNEDNLVMGRIEAERTDEVGQNEMFQFEKAEIERLVQSGKVARDIGVTNLVTASLSLTATVIKSAASFASFTGCAGFGFCVAFPIPAVIAGSVAAVVSAGVGVAEAAVSKDNGVAAYNRAKSTETKFNDAWQDGDRVAAGGKKVGVTYQSGNADYAEWLLKENPAAEYLPGEVIGIKDGSISYKTVGSDKLFVVSTQPVILGNMPEAGREDDYVKAAFMGQVPVQVVGRVDAGDYIVASGMEDGTAVALAPEDFRGHDFSRLLGVAWESGDAPLLNVVNVAVGLNHGVDQFAAKMDARLDALESESDALEKLIFSQVKGEKMNLYQAQNARLIPPLIVPESNATDGVPDLTDPDAWTVPTSSNFIGHDVTDEMMEFGWKSALKQAKKDGVYSRHGGFWRELEKDETLRTEFLAGLKDQINKHNEEMISSLDGYQALEMYDPVPARELMQKTSRRSKEASKEEGAPTDPKDRNSKATKFNRK